MNGKRYQSEKARRNGFYLALAVCLVAVGIAAWSTYDAVQDYLAPVSGSPEVSGTVSQRMETSSKEHETLPVTPKDDREDPENLPRESSAASQQSAQQTAGNVQQDQSASQQEESSQSPAEESQATETQGQPVEEQPGVLYELSSQMMCPVSSEEILKAYSSGAPVYSETMKDWRIHTGTDWKAESGEAVMACANGMVKSVYSDSMLGNVVWAEHGDYDFYYCGLGENFLVKEGDVITKGQQLGTITAVPMESAEEPHLHVEVKRSGVTMDPAAVIQEDN